MCSDIGLQNAVAGRVDRSSHNSAPKAPCLRPGAVLSRSNPAGTADPIRYYFVVADTRAVTFGNLCCGGPRPKSKARLSVAVLLIHGQVSAILDAQPPSLSPGIRPP